MAQHDFQTIDPAVYSGTDLANDLNAWVLAVISSHSGATRPSYLPADGCWYDSANSALKFYNGTSDEIILKGNITAFGVSVVETADAAALRTLLDLVIGTDVQAFDPATAKLDEDQSWSGAQRFSVVTDNDLLFDASEANNFISTPTANGTINFANAGSTGMFGHILLKNTANYTISANARVYISAADLTKISNTGTYDLSWYIGEFDKVYISASDNLTSGGA